MFFYVKGERVLCYICICVFSSLIISVWSAKVIFLCLGMQAIHASSHIIYNFKFSMQFVKDMHAICLYLF